MRVTTEVIHPAQSRWVEEMTSVIRASGIGEELGGVEGLWKRH